VHVHVSVCVFVWLRLRYSTLFGGIEAFSVEHFKLINGFSNQFFGWGGEDDNLYDRFQFRHVFVTYSVITTIIFFIYISYGLLNLASKSWVVTI